MSNSFTHIFDYHSSLISKQVIVYNPIKKQVEIGILDRVDQIIYGVLPSYNLIQEGARIKTSGIIAIFKDDFFDENSNLILEEIKKYVFKPYLID